MFLHGFNPWHINAININWYIGTLAIFIIISPWLYKAITNWENAVYLIGFTWIVSIVASFGVARIDVGTESYIWKAYWSILSIAAELPILSVGVLLYYVYYVVKLHIKIKNSMYIKKINLGMFLYVVLFGLLWGIFECIYYGASLMDYAILFGCIIFCQLVRDTKIINNILFSRIGEYSYGIYLFHMPILNKVNAIFESYGYNTYIHIFLVVTLLR